METKILLEGKSTNIRIGAATQTVEQTGWTAEVVSLRKANIGLSGLCGAMWIRKQWGCERGSFSMLSAHRLRPWLLDNLLSTTTDLFPQWDATKPNKHGFRPTIPPLD